MPKATQKSGAKSTNGACVFCNSSCENEELLGKKLARKNLTVHYFCMLFASGLFQSGKDELDGILGFLPRDIIKEVQRGKKLKCCFCKEKGATIGCVVRCCRQVFHFGCGRDNGVLNQFFGTYSSYCEEHRPRQTVPTSDRLAFHGTAKAVCAICMCAVEARASNETLRAPCCKNAWFHRSCIQRQATCSGVYFFKCPLCNNKDYFQHEMLEFGIYIPDQDAEWELEPDAYQELLERHCRCDKIKCQCPKGREYNKDGSKWEIILCVYCGCQGTHMQCSSLKGSAPSWTCDDCFDIARRSKKGQARSPKFSPLHKKNDTNWLMEKFNKEKLEAAGQGESSADKKRKYSSDSSEEDHQSPNQKKRKHLSFTNVSNSATNSSDLSKSTSKQGKRKYKKRRSTLKKDLDEDLNKDTSAGKSGDSAILRRQRRSCSLTQIPLVVTGKTARLLKGLEIDMTPKHNLSSVRPAIIAQEAPKTLGNELRKLAISMTPKFDYSSMAIGATSDSFKSQKKKGHSPAKNDSESAMTKSPAEKTDSVVNASKSTCTSSKAQCAEDKSRDLNIDVEDLPPKITGRSSIKRLTLEDMKKEEKGTSGGGDPTSTQLPKGLSVPSFTEEPTESPIELDDETSSHASESEYLDLDKLHIPSFHSKNLNITACSPSQGSVGQHHLIYTAEESFEEEYEEVDILYDEGCVKKANVVDEEFELVDLSENDVIYVKTVAQGEKEKEIELAESEGCSNKIDQPRNAKAVYMEIFLAYCEQFIEKMNNTREKCKVPDHRKTKGYIEKKDQVSSSETYKVCSACPENSPSCDPVSSLPSSPASCEEKYHIKGDDNCQHVEALEDWDSGYCEFTALALGDSKIDASPSTSKVKGVNFPAELFASEIKPETEGHEDQPIGSTPASGCCENVFTQPSHTASLTHSSSEIPVAKLSCTGPLAGPSNIPTLPQPFDTPPQVGPRYTAPQFGPTYTAPLPQASYKAPPSYTAPLPQPSYKAPPLYTAPLPQPSDMAPLPQASYKAPPSYTAPLPQLSDMAPLSKPPYKAPPSYTAPLPQPSDTAPLLGSSYTAPQLGPPYTAPHVGPTYTAPQVGPMYTGPQVGPMYTTPRVRPSYTAPYSQSSYPASLTRLVNLIPLKQPLCSLPLSETSNGARRPNTAPLARPSNAAPQTQHFDPAPLPGRHTYQQHRQL
ncbi:uncharacterized protein LOC106169620 [Lingula anatina]|uniref:Uncharacterized protein LOC106169620 n=1 Tax=Lingula anatina TaxID=7574 RepID=A0A1S3J2F4_LINAN|nr:uncharacterized protein LOC106169620 [Lingula anatina]XP_013404593.1 uncharacterized protein LOC106169620 [Lingula anatina]|eukprot:XP_013404592.1 uncharacterized protein LOC106169620 [Lingula anatina]